MKDKSSEQAEGLGLTNLWYSTVCTVITAVDFFYGRRLVVNVDKQLATAFAVEKHKRNIFSVIN